MPGKAKSQTRKARDARVEHEMLIQQVAQLYAEEQEKPAGERIGLRHVCRTVSEQYHREKGYWVSLAHNTVLARYNGRTSLSQARENQSWLTAHLLTRDDFYSLVKQRHEAREAEAAEKEGRQTARATYATAVDEWNQEEEGRKKVNNDITAAFKEAVILWERERDARKPQRPGWIKLKHGPLIPARPKPTQASIAADRTEDRSPDSDISEEADEEADKEVEDGEH